MKRYAIVRRKQVTDLTDTPSIIYKWMAYEYGLWARLFGFSRNGYIDGTYTSKSAECCEELLRVKIDLEINEFEIISIIEI
jgi:hypothetical protein